MLSELPDGVQRRLLCASGLLREVAVNPRLTAVSLMAFVLFSMAPAASCQDYFIGLTGSGSFMKDGADYAGTFLFGLTGTWSIDVDDSGWPAESDSTARFEHLWDTLFAENYDDTPGAEAWYGYLDASTLPAAPRFAFTTTSPEGHIAGDATLVIMMRDMNGDGVRSMTEKHRNCQVTMTLTVDFSQGEGEFFELCGNGGLGTGNLAFPNPPLDDVVQLTGSLHLFDCPEPVESRSWGAIKARSR
jgi:hypothetical protein